MVLHFEIDQEVRGCRDCIFSSMDDSFGECYCLMGGGIQNGKITERLIGTAPLSKYEERLWDRFDDTPPDWCPCAKVEKKDYDYN